MMIDDETLGAALAIPLERTNFEGLGARYEGKVRDNYRTPDGRRVLVSTDRISAFDRVLGTIPLKGQVLNGLSAFWFEKTRSVAANHVIAVPDPNVTVAVECQPLAVEIVVRAFLTGVTSTSIWTAYARGDREFCGHRLPEGLRKNDPLPGPIVTPSTKAAHGGHDVSVGADALVASGVVTRDEFEQVSAMALAVFAAGVAHCAAQGLILADTKYEFGRRPDGALVLIDEVHTPDSSRFWSAATYEARVREGLEPESFDKEYVRRWLASRGFTGEGAAPALDASVRLEAARRYITAYEQISGQSFRADLQPPIARIERALGLGAS